MDLERDERLIEARQLGTPIVFFALAVTLLTLSAIGPGPITITAAVLLCALALLAVVWGGRNVAITDRRIVEYRVLLARLARRFPRLAPLEAHRRVSIPLREIVSVRRSGPTILVSLRDGTKRELHCHHEADAARLLATIDEQVRKAPWMRPTRRVLEPKVTVTSQSDVGTRCPYCHDEVPGDEAAECDRCGAVQHEECIEIHGGCAAFSCGGTAKRRSERA